MTESEWDLVIIGCGAAGLVAGTIGGGLGMKVAAIESDRVGGDCSWYGCVPSKALIHSARHCWQLQQGPRGGVGVAVGEVDTSNVLEHVREQRAQMASGHTPEHLRELGMELFMGRPRLESGGIVRLEEQMLRARHILLATGSRARVPGIPGLDDVGYVTNRDIFELPQPPGSMLIVGGGPIGVEMAQAFQRLGTQVTVLEQGPEILPRDDVELTRELRDYLCAEGVSFVCNAVAKKVGRRGEQREVTVEVNGTERSFAADELLIATGREVNTDGLGLEDVGVSADRGLRLNRYLQTTNRRIWAAGDVTGSWQFSHVAEYEATTVMRSIALGIPQAARYHAAGWTTFTDPELASCGMNEQQTAERDLAYGIYRFSFTQDDRARVDEEGRGWVKIVAHPRTGRLYGAQILGPRAGELLQEFIIALERCIPVQQLCQMIHVYPTLTMASQRAGQMWWDAWGKEGLAPKALRFYLRARGFRGRKRQ